MLSDDLKPYIDRIVKREITNRELARVLNTNETYVCRVLKRMGIVREAIIAPPSTKEIRAARAEHRRLVATTLPVKEAAAAAGCSERTIYRIRSKQ
jgi:AraC-like DNA-binding protein